MLAVVTATAMTVLVAACVTTDEVIDDEGYHGAQMTEQRNM